MASMIHGRLRLPVRTRMSFIGLLGMLGLVWLLLFGPGPRLHRTAESAGGFAPPAAGTSGASSAPGGLSPRLARLSATDPHRRVEVIIQLNRGVSIARGRALVRTAGGRPGLDLHIINALSATLTAGATRTLASSPQVHFVSLNATLQQTWHRAPTAWQLSTSYDQSVHATGLWNRTTGRGVGVAVVDTGIAGDLADFQRSRMDSTSRVVASAVIDPNASTAADTYGHGTAVAGLIAGNSHNRAAGDPLRDRYAGSAPNANLIAVKVANDNGQATTLDAIYGLQFAVDHKAQYDIRVVNLSFRSTDAESYKTDPLDAAAEQAWFAGITVVAAAGNMGTASDAVSYAPGNDPYVITVGAVDDQGSAHNSDDVVTSWSSRGTTQDGIAKPDVVAPGAHIISTLAPGSDFASLCPTCVVGGSYFQVSGTSLAAPIVAGVAADLLAAHPDWTPDMVKGALVSTATEVSGGGAGEVNAVAADRADGDQLASDRNLTPNTLIDPSTGSIDYNAASWSAGSWSTAADPLAASWSAASWSCEGCSSGTGNGGGGDGGGVDPTAASWSTLGWTTMWG